MFHYFLKRKKYHKQGKSIKAKKVNKDENKSTQTIKDTIIDH